jgi:hypothetical protein
MTLPASFPLSMSQIATEIGASLPLSLSDARVVFLANKSALPVSFSNLLGKTGRFDGSALASSTGGGVFVSLGFAIWFGGELASFGGSFGGPGGTNTTLSFQGGGPAAPNWNGNIKVINNTTSTSVILSKENSFNWGNNLAPINLVRSGFTDSFTIIPST